MNSCYLVKLAIYGSVYPSGGKGPPAPRWPNAVQALVVRLSARSALCRIDLFAASYDSEAGLANTCRALTGRMQDPLSAAALLQVPGRVASQAFHQT